MRLLFSGIALGFLFFDKRGKNLVTKLGNVADKGINTVLDNSKKAIAETMPETSKIFKIKGSEAEVIKNEEPKE
ncbi:MAG: hypothetical protein RR795_01605 [Cetobacterium sp.]|uniref:hypothetical protein n=1 Tax=Cetobacterium sp. TaxID=2071632 RepID=UPI002FC84240